MSTSPSLSIPFHATWESDETDDLNSAKEWVEKATGDKVTAKH